MRSAVLVFSFALLVVANVAAAEADPKKLPAVKKVLAEAVAGVQANRKACDEANERQLEKARDELEAIAKQMLDEGKTEEATAVLNQVKTVDTEILGAASAADGALGVGGKRKLLERMAGKWNRPGSENLSYEISKDGSATGFRKTSNQVFDRARLVSVDSDTADVAWGTGWRTQYRLAGDDVIAVREWNPKGLQTQGYVLERVK